MCSFWVVIETLWFSDHNGSRKLQTFAFEVLFSKLTGAVLNPSLLHSFVFLKPPVMFCDSCRSDRQSLHSMLISGRHRRYLRNHFVTKCYRLVTKHISLLITGSLPHQVRQPVSPIFSFPRTSIAVSITVSLRVQL